MVREGEGLIIDVRRRGWTILDDSIVLGVFATPFYILLDPTALAVDLGVSTYEWYEAG